MSNIDLNLTQYQNSLRIKKEGNVSYVFDPVRSKHIVLQPEELVRQLLLIYLVQEKKYPLGKIAVEIGLKVNELQKRCDILLYDKDFNPFMIIECKAPSVEINDAVFFQAAIYNLPLQVPYIMLSNGINNYCARLNYEQNKVEILIEIPSPV
jgi:hypothetical protein